MEKTVDDGFVRDPESYKKETRIEDIKEFLSKLHPHGRTHIRAISQVDGSILQGFFDDHDILARRVVNLNSDEATKYNIYFGVNQFSDDRICQNTMAKGLGTKKGDIEKITSVCIDIDPVTDEYPAPMDAVKDTIAAGNFIADCLHGQSHLPRPIIVSSGNGVQMFWKCTYKMYDDEIEFGSAFISHVYNLIHEKYDFKNKHNVVFDTTVGSASQIMRLPGTINWKTKGSDEESYGYRVAHVISDSKFHEIQPILCERIYENGCILLNQERRKFVENGPWSQEDIDNVDKYFSIEYREMQASAYAATFDDKYKKEDGGFESSRNCYFWKKVGVLHRSFIIPIESAAKIVDKVWNQNRCHPPLTQEEMDKQLKGVSSYDESPIGCLLPNLDEWKVISRAEKAIEDAEVITSDTILKAYAAGPLYGAMVKITRENKKADTGMSKSRDIAMPSDIVRAPELGGYNAINDIADFYERYVGKGRPASVFSAALATLACVSSKYYAPLCFHSINDKSHTGMFIVNVSATGAGKTRGISAMKKLLSLCGMRSFFGGEQFVSDANLRASLASRPGTGVMFAVDEMGSKMSKSASSTAHYNANINAIIRDYYGCEDQNIAIADSGVARQKEKGIKINKKGVALIYRPCLTIFGAMTENQMEILTSDEHRKSGFSNRFVVFSDGTSRTWDEIEEEENPFKFDYNKKYVKTEDTVPERLKRHLETVVDLEIKAPKKDKDRDPAIAEFMVAYKDYYKTSSLLVGMEKESRFDFLQDLHISEDMIVQVIPSEKVMDDIFRLSKRTQYLSNKFTDMRKDGLANDMARVIENVGRLCSLSAIGRDAVNPYIESEDLQWAIGIANYSVKTMVKFCGVDDFDSDKTAALYMRMLKKAREAYIDKMRTSSKDIVYLTRSDLKNVFRNARSSGDQALDYLRLAHDNGDILLFEGDRMEEAVEKMREKGLMEDDFLSSGGKSKRGTKPSLLFIPRIGSEQRRIIMMIDECMDLSKPFIIDNKQID